MIDLLAIYECRTCGDVLEDEVTLIGEIDTDRDEVYTLPICNRCGREVTRKYGHTPEGERVPCCEQVDHERWLWYVDNVNAGAECRDGFLDG